jgi:hypothetical protein
MESRWAMSYLRGPLTRDQIKQVMAPAKGRTIPAARPHAPAAATASESARAGGPAPAVSAAAPLPRGSGGERPMLPPDIQQFFVPAASSRPASAGLTYVPMAVGVASVGFSDAKSGVSHTRALTVLAEIDARLGSVAWGEGAAIDIPAKDLGSDPEGSARFEALPPAAAKAKTYDGWTKGLKSWLGQSQSLELFKSGQTGVVSAPGESERDFRIRLQTLTREQRDQAVAKLRQKYAGKIATLDEKIRRVQQTVERESEQATQQKLQTAVSMGATVLGALFGRKTFSTSTLGRATTAARGVGRSMKESQDIDRAKETLAAAQQQKRDLEADIQAELGALGGAMDPLTETMMPFVLKPKRTEVSVQLVALAWAPAWEDAQGSRTPAYR